MAPQRPDVRVDDIHCVSLLAAILPISRYCRYGCGTETA
jgi:hypothetical protein